jgi:hypothetical protein
VNFDKSVCHERKKGILRNRLRNVEKFERNERASSAKITARITRDNALSAAQPRLATSRATTALAKVITFVYAVPNAQCLTPTPAFFHE